MKRVFIIIFILGIFIILIFYCYYNLSPQQKAEKLIKKGDKFFEKYEVCEDIVSDTSELLLALKCYTKAIQLSPYNYEAHTARGRVYNKLGQYQKAIDNANEAIKIIGNNLSRLYRNRGSVYWNLNQYQKAIDDCNKALELKTIIDHIDKDDCIEIYYFRGQSYYQLGYYQKALDDFNKSIDIFKSGTETIVFPEVLEAEVCLARALCYYKLKQYHNAIDDCIKVINNNGVLDADIKAWAYYHLGLSYYYGLGESQKGIYNLYRAAVLSLEMGGSDADTILLSVFDEIKKIDTSSWVIGKLSQKAVEYFYRKAFSEIEEIYNRYDEKRITEYMEKMKRIDPSSPLIQKLMDKIYAEPKKKK